jgi:acyl carrier protein
MNKIIIFTTVQDIFRDIFDDESLIILDTTNSDNLEEWDSLNHILLISSIQEEFKIKISLEEMQLKTNVEFLVNMIFRKIK